MIFTKTHTLYPRFHAIFPRAHFVPMDSIHKRRHGFARCEHFAYFCSFLFVFWWFWRSISLHSPSIFWFPILHFWESTPPHHLAQAPTERLPFMQLFSGLLCQTPPKRGWVIFHFPSIKKTPTIYAFLKWSRFFSQVEGFQGRLIVGWEGSLCF